MAAQRILIVEPNQTTSYSIAAALRAKGWDAITAADGVQALNIALKLPPDAIVMNTHLPAGGGLNTLKRMRLCADTACVPVIALASGPAEEDSDFLNAGAQEVLAQPADPQGICAAVEKQFGKRMKAPALAPSEAVANPERITALQSTGLLESAPIEHINRLTRFAAKILGAPVVLVSLVDKDRQVFKSQVGLKEPFTSGTPLTHSFCQWVVSGKDKLVVRDAREHPTLKDNLAIRDLGVIAYCGVPLLERSSQAIGSFCAIDQKPREWSADELATLFDLAKIVEGVTTLAQFERDRDTHGGVDLAAGPATKLIQAVTTGIAALARLIARHEARLNTRELDDLLRTTAELASDLRAFRRQSP